MVALDLRPKLTYEVDGRALTQVVFCGPADAPRRCQASPEDGQIPWAITSVLSLSGIEANYRADGVSIQNAKGIEAEMLDSCEYGEDPCTIDVALFPLSKPESSLASESYSLDVVLQTEGGDVAIVVEGEVFLPYAYHTIAFPLDLQGTALLNFNYNCPTSYGDRTHNGLDIETVIGMEVPVYAVDPGFVAFTTFTKSSVGYELLLYLGRTLDDRDVYALYVHLGELSVISGDVIDRNDGIGFIKAPFGGGDHLQFELKLGGSGTPEGGDWGTEFDPSDVFLKLAEELSITNVRFNPECPVSGQ